ETMTITRRLQAHGQCRISDQGSFTVSRPEYALLSTGLEVDRSGSRNNASTEPLFAQSIWDVARQASLSVSAASHRPCFGPLFPNASTRFTHLERYAENVFRPIVPLDVNLFHPLYVDEAAHTHGAASPEYHAAVARVDAEIAGLLE